jgi:amino acid transporter
MMIRPADPIIGDSAENSPANEENKPGSSPPTPSMAIKSFDVWALGITIVIGGQFFSWNEGLTAGFGSFAVAMFLLGLAYICLVLCNAELSSALPFAGMRSG